LLALSKGQQVNGWVLEKWLGEGGNGVVWKAQHTDGRIGALKFLMPWKNENGDDFYEPKRYARFRDEVEAFLKCQDIEGVLPLLDRYIPDVKVPLLNDPPWVALAYATTFEEALGDNYSLDNVVNACASFAHTLAKMHERGFSHRDIKPDNLFYYKDYWCLGDFGLVAFPGKLAETSSGERLGPRFYVADEMLNNASNADGSLADVYSLAKTLWKLATHQAYPLQGTIFSSDSSMCLSTYCNHPRAYRLDAVIEQATKYIPEQRIRMIEFHHELSSWLSPQSKATGDPSSLDHLVPRIEAIQGEYTQQKQHIQTQNTKIENKIRVFLEQFDNLLTRMHDRFKDVGIDSMRTSTQGGRHHAWIAVVGEESTKDSNYWQNDLIATIQNPHTHKLVTVFIGVCIRTDVKKTKYGIMYEIEGPVESTAAVSINRQPDIMHQKKIAGSRKSFVLGGVKEESVTDHFLTVLEGALSKAVEAAISEIETK